MANFFLLLILYNYFFVRNNSIISITYKELYIIVFVSSILGVFSLLSKKIRSVNNKVEGGFLNGGRFINLLFSYDYYSCHKK